uniref:Glycosyltransferase family 1 protein n=1 Tax=Ignavibacterium album TaxID=591197 RepID=A0A832DKB6_9BACT
MKVAQVTPYYHPSIGGVAGVAKYIAEELVNRGHEVDVITAYRDHKERPKLNAPRKEIINGVNVYRYRSILNIGHMSYMPGLIPHFIKNKYDVIHYHSYRHPLCDVSAFFGKIKGSVNILHSHGPFFERGEISRLKHFLYDSYDKIASLTTLQWTDKIIAFNGYEINNYMRLVNDRNKIELIYNAANPQSFQKYDTQDFIKKYGLENKKIILCLGILNASKRQDLLIEALPLIIKEVPDAFLILVGPDGGYLEKVNEAAKRLNMFQYFKYLGPISDLEKNQAFDSAKLFTLTSDKDAYPLVIAEAMAHNLPVVATDARGPKDMIHDSIDGFVVPKRDIKAIADAIIKLLKDDELRKKMGINARLNAEKNHSAIGAVDKLEKIYFELYNLKKKFVNGKNS